MHHNATITPCLLLLLTASVPPARAQTAPAPTVPAVPAFKTPSEAEARTQFATEDAARLAAKDGTEERAKAAQDESALAGVIAWDEFDAGHYDEAAAWFARRAAHEKEYYTEEATFYTTVKKPQLDQTQRNLEANFTRLRARLAAETDPKQKAILQSVVDRMPATLHALPYSYLSEMETLADGAGNVPALLGFYQQELALDQAQLADMQRAGLPPEKITKQQEAVARSVGRIGDAQERMAQFDEAEKSYRQALALRRSLAEGDAEHDIYGSLSDLARLYSQKGELPQARTLYEQALQALADNQPALQRALAAGPPPEVAGLPQKSVDEYMATIRQGLTLDDAGSRQLILNNLGDVVKDLGDYKSALDFYQKALDAQDALPADGLLGLFRKLLRVKTLNNIAVAHGDSGEIAQAIQEELAVVALDKSLGEDAATDLNNLGGWYSDQGDDRKALLYVKQARQSDLAKQDLRGVINATLFLAVVAENADQMAEAEDDAQQGLTLARQLGDLGWRGEAARALASVRLKQGRLDDADALLQEAAAADAQVGAPLDTEYTEDLQGRVLEARGDPGAALAKYKAAIDLLEKVRASTASTADFSNKQNTYRVYERIVRLLIKLGRPEEAFDYYNRSGSTQLQESLSRANVKTADPALQALLDRARGLKAQQQALTAQVQAEQSKPPTQRDAAKVKNLQYLLAATQGAFFHVTDAIRKKDENLYDSVVPVKPTELSDAQSSIPPGVALIEYAPLGDQLYVFVATRDGLKVYDPPVKPADLNARIKAARAQLTSPVSAAPPVARGTAEVASPAETEGPPLADNLSALYDMLIAPIAPAIAGKKILAFIPTQLLYYLPMQALGYKESHGLHYLIQDRQLVYLAGADVLKAVSAPPSSSSAGARLVAFGNPTGADLPFAQAEVEAIARIFPASTIYTGAQATKTAIGNTKTRGARILHFATHGVLDSTDPDNSYIFLAGAKTSAQGQLTFGEIQGLRLNKVDLVTLSACQTALQAQDPNGSEVASLAEAFSRAHAHTVLASLWPVADESTQALMVAFYKNLAAGQSKAAALRGAQLTLLHDPRYSHPYYWAPFILLGDWK